MVTVLRPVTLPFTYKGFLERNMNPDRKFTFPPLFFIHLHGGKEKAETWSSAISSFICINHSDGRFNLVEQYYQGLANKLIIPCTEQGEIFGALYQLLRMAIQAEGF